MKRAAALLALVASACVPSEGPSMSPFVDCLGCHGQGGEGKTWTAAGTWAKGAQVTITDANGKSFTLKGNSVGNFYTREGLQFPLTVSVDGTTMPAPVTYGGCNACHNGSTVTTGPNMAPGADCLTCHNPQGIASRVPFSAAGTFPPAGQTVQVGNRTTTTNSVGNFYITGPIDGSLGPNFSPPVNASVGGAAMEGGAPYGGCGRCHGAGGPGGAGG